MTGSMMMAGGVLVVTLVILVGVAVIWYLRSEHEI